MSNRVWRKSTRCAADKPQCVEVALDAIDSLVRDSKAPDVAGILTVPAGNWTRFVNHLTR